MDIIITSPSLDARQNVSGISSIVQVIVSNNRQNKYVHFRLGKRDDEARHLSWFLRTMTVYASWCRMLLIRRDRLIHFNLALDTLALIRDVPLILATRLSRRRMILHLHGGAMSVTTKASPWRQYLLKLVLGGRSPKIVLSRLEQRGLQAAIKRDNIVVLPNCVDLTAARAFQRQYGRGEPLVVLFMGRICAAKGIDYIYEALDRLTNNGVRLRFVMAGAGPDQARNVARFGNLLGDSFEFEGIVSGNRKTALLTRCDVFLLPSFFEGLPMALLEGMSFGLVPVTTAVGSIGDVVKDGRTGLVVRPRSGSEIAAAIARLTAESELRERLSRNARQLILDNYCPESYVARLNDIYQYD